MWWGHALGTPILEVGFKFMQTFSCSYWLFWALLYKGVPRAWGKACLFRKNKILWELTQFRVSETSCRVSRPSVIMASKSYICPLWPSIWNPTTMETQKACAPSTSSYDLSPKLPAKLTKPNTYCLPTYNMPVSLPHTLQHVNLSTSTRVHPLSTCLPT